MMTRAQLRHGLRALIGERREGARSFHDVTVRGFRVDRADRNRCGEFDGGVDGNARSRGASIRVAWVDIRAQRQFPGTVRTRCSRYQARPVEGFPPAFHSRDEAERVLVGAGLVDADHLAFALSIGGPRHACTRISLGESRRTNGAPAITTTDCDVVSMRFENSTWSSKPCSTNANSSSAQQ